MTQATIIIPLSPLPQLTTTDEIDMATVNRTLASFEVPEALGNILEQNKQACLELANSVVVTDLTFPLGVQLGRQFTFYQCVLQQLVTACDSFQQQQGALAGIDGIGDILNTGSIDEILDTLIPA